MQGHTSKTVQEWLKYLFPDEIPELKRLAQSLPDNPTVVNIGAGGGTSGLAFLESRPDLFLITIDITNKSSPFGCLAGEEDVLRSAGFWGLGRNDQIHGDSKQVGKDWKTKLKKGLVDMVFVDGEHSYEGCTGDINNWMPNLKKGGILAVHDYKKGEVFKRTDLPKNVPAPRPWIGVDNAVDLLLLDKYEKVGHVDSLIAFRIK